MMAPLIEKLQSGGGYSAGAIGTKGSNTALFFGNLPSMSMASIDAMSGAEGASICRIDLNGEVALFGSEVCISNSLYASMRAYIVFSTMCGEACQFLSAEESGGGMSADGIIDRTMADVNADQGGNAAVAMLCAGRVLAYCWHLTGILATVADTAVQEYIAGNCWIFRDLEVMYVATESVLRRQHSEAGGDAVAKMCSAVRKIELFLYKLSQSLTVVGSTGDAEREYHGDIFGAQCSEASLTNYSHLSDEKSAPSFEVVLFQMHICIMPHFLIAA